MSLAKRAMALATQLQDKQAVGYATIGVIHANLRADNAAAADSLIERTLPQYQPAKSGASDVYLKLRMEKTNILASRADYEGAVKELLAIAQQAEQARQYAVLSRAFNELGVISYNRNELDKALEYYRRALSYNDRNEEKALATAYAYINIGMVHGWLEHYDSALYYLSQAKPLCEQVENLYYLANAYAVEANVYKWSGRLPQAESAMLRMVALREQTEGSITFSNEQLSLANFYVYAKAFDKAIATYKNGLAYSDARRAAGTPTNYELVLHYYEGLAKSYNALGSRDEYEGALQHIIAVKDTLSEKNSTEAIAEMQTKYDVQKKETTIIAQKLDITRKNVLFYGSLVLLVTAAIIAWLLFRNYRRRSQMRVFLQQEADKRRAAEAVREAEEAERKRIASDLHDNLGSYAASIKSNADELKRNPAQPLPVLELLQSNAQQMVSLLSDTIWAMRKSGMKLSDISDRIKLVMQRLRPNYPEVRMRVNEDLDTDIELPPAHTYHLFMIVQEAIINALRHSGCSELIVHIQGAKSWTVRISDNGRGIDTGLKLVEGGNGMFNMRARVESMNCSIEWNAGSAAGTEVVVMPNAY
jgi:signal transduction histidine kinase